MTDTLVDLHIAHLQAGGKSPRTVEARLNVLGLLDRHLPFGLAYGATEQIEAWLARYRDSAWTIYTYHYHLAAFYRWATSAGFLDGDPAAMIAKPRHPKALPNPISEEELSRMLALPEPIATAVVLAAFEGLRVGEIAACRREHVTEALVTVPRGKGGQPGTVPTHPFAWAWIRDRPAGLLVTNRRGQPVSGHWISVTARYHLDKAGLRGVRMHRGRHRFGTKVQELFGDIRVTQECMRHSNVASTEGYTLVTASQRAAVVAALPVPGAPASSTLAGAEEQACQKRPRPM